MHEGQSAECCNLVQGHTIPSSPAAPSCRRRYPKAGFQMPVSLPANLLLPRWNRAIAGPDAA